MVASNGSALSISTFSVYDSYVWPTNQVLERSEDPSTNNSQLVSFCGTQPPKMYPYSYFNRLVEMEVSRMWALVNGSKEMAGELIACASPNAASVLFRLFCFVNF